MVNENFNDFLDYVRVSDVILIDNKIVSTESIDNISGVIGFDFVMKDETLISFTFDDVLKITKDTTKQGSDATFLVVLKTELNLPYTFQFFAK